MNIKDVVAVSGLPGLYTMVASRNNGMLIRDFDSKKTRFASVRKHQFTPLDSIAIYTDMNSVELKEIFRTMKDKDGKTEIPQHSADKEVLFEYFGQILPEYDRDRVKLSDVKKVIKWYHILDHHGRLEPHEEEE